MSETRCAVPGCRRRATFTATVEGRKAGMCERCFRRVAPELASGEAREPKPAASPPPAAVRPHPDAVLCSVALRPRTVSPGALGLALFPLRLDAPAEPTATGGVTWTLLQGAWAAVGGWWKTPPLALRGARKGEPIRTLAGLVGDLKSGSVVLLQEPADLWPFWSARVLAPAGLPRGVELLIAHPDWPDAVGLPARPAARSCRRVAAALWPELRPLRGMEAAAALAGHVALERWRWASLGIRQEVVT